MSKEFKLEKDMPLEEMIKGLEVGAPPAAAPDRPERSASAAPRRRFFAAPQSRARPRRSP